MKITRNNFTFTDRNMDYSLVGISTVWVGAQICTIQSCQNKREVEDGRKYLASKDVICIV